MSSIIKSLGVYMARFQQSKHPLAVLSAAAWKDGCETKPICSYFAVKLAHEGDDIVEGTNGDWQLWIAKGSKYSGAPYALHLADKHDLQSANARAIYQINMYVSASAWLYWVLPILVQASPTIPEDDELKPVPKTDSKPVCTLPNCTKIGDKSCKNKRALQEHVVTKHTECYPATCPVDGCPRTDFASFIHIDKHMKEDHLEYAMALYDRDMFITCRFEGYEVCYKAHVCYRNHLQKEHRVNQPTVLEQEKPKGHSCYVEGCNTPHKFSSPSEYDSHLIQTHSLHTPNQRRIFLKGTASRWVENYAPFIYNARFV